MVEDRASIFLNRRNVHEMYQLKKELYSVAGACGVRLEGDKK